MKVGLVIYDNLDIQTGGYLYDRKLVEYLRKKGDQVEIISLEKQNYIRNILDNFSESFLNRLINAEIDVLLQDELNHPSLFWLNAKLKKKIKYPLVTIVHHLSYSASLNYMSKLFYRIIEKRYLSTVDGFIFNSKTNQDFLESFMGKSLLGVVAYPGRDHIKSTGSQDDTASYLSKSEPLRILFVGNLLQHKGLHTLIDALSSIDKKKWILTVIGNSSISPNYTRHIYNLIEKYNLNSRVKFLGFVSSNELVDSFKKNHLLVVPSVYEGFGIVYLEAQGFGIPVIASTNGAAKEIIRHGKEGFLVPPGDFQLLSKYISILIENPDLLLKMSENSLRRYEEFPYWSASMKRVRDFLVSIT